MFLRSCLSVIALVGALSASAVELFWVGESQPQRFDTRMLSANGFGTAVVHDGGRLTSDANWAANAVHVVYGTLVVETNVTLTIQAGVVVQFAGGGIYVRGDCIANGVRFADAASDEVVSYVLKGNVVTDETTTFRGRDYQDDFLRHGDSSSFAFDTRGLLGKAPSGTVMHWGGRLATDETWAAGQTHLVYGSVTVPTNVTLTVERGAVVKFAGGGIRADGPLVAEGAMFADLDDDSVGGDTRKDGWTQPHVSYAIDGDVYDAADTIYRCLDTHGEWLLDGASVASAFNSRNLGSEDFAGAVVHDGGVMTTDDTWNAGSVHIVYGTIVVATNATLTIERGALVKFVGGGILALGECVANGVEFTDAGRMAAPSYSLTGNVTMDDETIVEGNHAADSDVAGASSEFVYFNNATNGVRYAHENERITFSTEWDGSSAVAVNAVVPSGETVVLTNGEAVCEGVIDWSPTSGGGEYEFSHVTDSGTMTATLVALDGIVFHNGPITSDTVWTKDVVHVVDGRVTVRRLAKLTIEAGAVVKFMDGTSLSVKGGTCEALGVTFTHINDDAVGGDTMNDGDENIPVRGGYSVDEAVVVDRSTVQRYLSNDQQTVVIEDLTVVQRYPWNGIVDVDFTLYCNDPTAYTPIILAAVDGERQAEMPVRTYSCETSQNPTNSLLLAVGRHHVEWQSTLDDRTLVSSNVTVSVRRGNGTLPSEVAAVLPMDSRMDTRIVRGTERLFYSPDWIGGGPLTVECNGERLVEATESGWYEWNAEGLGSGLYAFALKGRQNELVAKFAIPGEDTEIHTGQEPWDESTVTWKADTVHVIERNVVVPSGKILVVEPGAVVKLFTGISLTIAKGGTCIAKGVTFTHINDDTIGGDTLFDGNAEAPIQDGYVVDGVEDDETTEYRYMTPPSLVTSGTLNKDVTWKGWNVYRVTGNLTIAKGVTLTIMPGAIIKFDDGKSLTVNSGATLNAIGTRAQPIVFTSVKDDEHGGDTNGDGGATKADCGDWKEIVVSGSFNANYVNILYGAGGGASNTVDAIKIYSGGVVEMKNSRLEHLQRYAVCDEGGSSHFENCVINDAYMAFRHGSGYRDVFDNCVIHDCSYLSNNGGQVFRNCIVANLTTDWQWGTQYGLVQCQNCVFWNKDAKFGPHALPNVQSGSKDNSWADPRFVDPGKGDFRIAETSPCIDAGDGTFAPAADWYGQPRKTNLMVEQTGKPNAKGEYVDIGICEVQPRNVKSDIDLALVSVLADASATIGEVLNVSWTVENLGSANATGSWRDTFELIDASGATIKLGSYTVSGGIVAGGKRIFTAKFNVPSAAVGAARLRVKVNAERDVFEGMIMDNNVAYAGGTIDLALAAYTPDECSTLVVGAGSSTALAIPADSGITALIIRGGAGVSAYGAYGYMPKALRNDSAAVRLEDGSLLLTLPSTDAAGDFTFVIANGGYGAETVSIEPVTESLEITEVTPNRLANTGDGYLTLRGVALDKVAQVRLVGGTTLAPTAFNAASLGELSATFPLADATPGTYALEVEDAYGETYRLDAAVEIYKPKMGPKLEAHLEIPTAVRQGRIYTGKIVYSNVGDTDMYAPWLLLEMSGATIFVDGQEFDGSSLEVVGISASYPQGVLKAGEANELEITFRCDSSLNFSLSTEEYRPDDKGVAKLIADMATRVNRRGRSVYLLGDLMRYLESTETDPDKYAVSGVLLEEVDGSPLAGVELGAYDSAGGCASSDTVDEYGRFVLDGLTVGERYTVKVLSPDVTGSFVVPESGGDDVDGGVWFATKGFPICLTLSHLEEDWEQVHLAVVPLTGSNAGTTTNMALEMSPDCRVEMRLPSAGTYLVVARDGTGLEAASVVKVSTFDVATAVDLDFSAGSKVFGTVCDNDGVPIAAADVVIKSVENGASIAAPTNEDGNYRVGVLPAGEYVIGVSAEGYYQQIGKIIQVDGKDDYLDVDFSLEAMPNELKGEVKLPGGKEWLVVFEDASGTISRSVLTDADGNFSIKRLPECKGVLSVYDENDLLQWIDQDVSIDEAVKVVTVEGDQTCYMVCRAYSEEGALIPSTWVWTAGTGNEQMASSDDRGESIVAILKGEYRVSVVADGYVDGVLYENADESKRVSITLRKAGYCRFLLPADVDAGTLDLVSFNSGGLHYGGSSFGDGHIVSTTLEPGAVQMFAVQGSRAFYSEASTVTGGITNDVRKLDGNELKIDLSEQDWSRVSTVRIYHRDGSGIVLSREVTSRILRFSEYPDVALKIEARGVHQEVLATAMRAKGDCATVQLFPSDTVNISGALQGATFSQLLGATVSFSSVDGHKLREVALAQDGRFVATAVPTAFASLWFSLSDGTAFSVSKSEAELSGYVCVVPDDLGSQVLKIEDKSGNAIVGIPFVVTDATGNSTVQTTDSRGQLSIRRKSGKQTVTPVDKTSQIETKQVEVPQFVCPVCHKNPCVCPSGSEPKVCEKCGKNPCVCVPEKITVKERNTNDEEVIPQYELPAIRFKYGETLVDDIDFHQWSYWSPGECWASSIEEGLTRYIDAYNRMRKAPPPYVAACEERKCTYNQRVYKRYLKAQREFLDEYDKISAALEEALARSRQCRRLLRNTANGELVGGYTSYMLGNRIQAPCGAGYGEQLYVGTTRSVISSGPSAVAGYANAREEGALNPAEGMNREGGASIAQNIVGDLGEAAFENSDNFSVRTGGGAVAIASGPVQSFNQVNDDHVRYRNEMERRISAFGGMFANLEAKLQYYIGAVNTPYHECMRTYSPYDTPYAMYTSPLVIYRVPIVQSCDPNEMAGPMGVGDPETERFVRPGEWLTYTVYFENQSNATAAAQEVYVTNPLSEWLDLDSFEMGEVAFNNQIDLGLVGAQNGSCETDLAGTAYRARTNVTLDRELSTVGWYLRIVDPTTPAEWPEDPYAGLLPPNDETHRGEGHLTYRIKVREDAPRNTVITNLASIVFDYNEAIETDPFWWNIAGWPFTLGEAVNNEMLEWTTGGEADWLQTWDDSAADGQHDAVVTGIGNNTNSWIRTVVDGPGTVSFAWCGALASRNTKMQFLVDGSVEAILSGSNGWERVSVTVYGEGGHELMWKMQTGRSGASADDFAALDCVGWTPTPPPTLAEALNPVLKWTADGDAEWHGVARDSLVSTREAWASVSGLGDFEYAAVETRVYGSGTLRFDWAVSCEEEYDELILFVDGKPRKSITGEVGWKSDAVEITGRMWHTVRWEYVKDDLDELELVGDNQAMLDNVAWESDDELLPTVKDDEGATVTGDAETGFVVRPSEGNTAVEVTIPQGVDAAKVTVEVSTKVESVKPHGAKVKVVSGDNDITNYLVIPQSEDVMNIAAATVKEEIVKEALDPSKDAVIELNAANPRLTTAPTRKGLTYTLFEGHELQSLSKGDSKLGDGNPWEPEITVSGGNAAFYSIDVSK